MVMVSVLPSNNNDEMAHGYVKPKIHVYDVTSVVGGWPQRQREMGTY